MSIRMIILTNAEDGKPFRLAAHSVAGYRPSPLSAATIVYASLGTWHVTETVEQIDAKFFVPDNDAWTPQEVDEVVNADGELST